MRAQYDIYPARAPAPAGCRHFAFGAQHPLPWVGAADDAPLCPSQLCAWRLRVPGGGLEAQDAQEGLPVLTRPTMPAAQRQAAIAAVRETFEEMGLLLAVHADGRPATQADVDALDCRAAPVWPQLLARGLQLDLRGVWLLAHWTAEKPMRAQTLCGAFFIALAPQG